MATKYGAFCLTADAIVPLHADNDWTCDWCGSRHHFIRYEWGWDESAGRHDWQPITVDPVPPALINKPENFSEDGI